MKCLFKDCNNDVYQNGVCQKHFDEFDQLYNKFEIDERPNKQLTRKNRKSKNYLET